MHFFDKHYLFSFRFLLKVFNYEDINEADKEIKHICIKQLKKNV